jgi:hypothetical protein
MLRHILRNLGCTFLLVGGLWAQPSVFVTYSGAFQPDSLGLPKNPPFISIMTVMFINNVQTGDVPLNVQRGIAEETVIESVFRNPDFIRNPQPPTLQENSKITLKFDVDGHEIERNEEDVSLGAYRKITQALEGEHLVSQIGESENQKGKRPSGWLKIAYSDGHVVEIKKGRGDELENHFVNLKYDPQGRITRYEYREGKNDVYRVSTVVRYTGDSVETDELAPDGIAFTKQLQKLDGDARVIDVRYSDLSEGQLKLWYHASFRYDDRGRVIEQVSDERELGEGDDYVPLPGRVVIQYDDEKLTRTQNFYEKGKVALKAVAQLDRDGEELSLRLLDGAGDEKQPSEIVPDRTTGKPVPTKGKCAWEVDYDSQGNWMERRLWFTPADGTPKLLLKKYRRTLTYR